MTGRVLPDLGDNPLSATRKELAEAEGRLRLRSLDIDPRRLLYFATVVELGSFSKAAKTLGLTQPGLSTAMNRLEAELGLKLVTRGAWGVTPTYYGEMLYSHSRKQRDELQLAERNLIKGANPERFPTRLGCLPSLASNVVPTAISRWRKTHRERELRVVDAVQFDLLNGLIRRELDLFVGFTESYHEVEGLRRRILFRDRLAVVARAGHPLLRKRDVDLASLVQYPWVIMPAGPFNLGFEDVLEEAGIRQLGATTVCDSIALMKGLVSRDDHLTLMPEHAVQNEIADGRLAVVPYSIPGFQRHIAVFVRQGTRLDPGIRALIGEIQAVGSELNGEDNDDDRSGRAVAKTGLSARRLDRRKLTAGVAR